MNPESVRGRMARSVSKLPRRMSEGSVIIVVENVDKFNEVEGYPNLNEYDNRIRFSPFTGEIYISTYRENAKRLEQAVGAEVILMQRGANPLQKMSKRWNGYSDIECAIRATGHILDKSNKKGKMVKNTLGAIDLTKHLLSKFESGEVNKENIEMIAQETFQELASLGFINAEKPIRQKLTAQIIKATEKDILERVNPLISRTRLASAWLKAIRELLVAKKVREKFSAILTDLSSERDVERFYLSQVAELVRDMLENQEMNSFKSEVLDLKTLCSDFLTPEKIKVSPYRKPALLVKYCLFGVRNELERNLAIVMSADEQEAVNILDITPIDKIIENAIFRNNAHWEIQDRLALALESMNSALNKGDRDLKKNHLGA